MTSGSFGETISAVEERQEDQSARHWESQEKSLLFLVTLSHHYIQSPLSIVEREKKKT